MNPEIIISNLTNPTLLFFVLGIIAVMIKSDLEIPPQISKFLSLYLLFSIGFKGGMELAHSGFTKEVALTLRPCNLPCLAGASLYIFHTSA